MEWNNIHVLASVAHFGVFSFLFLVASVALYHGRILFLSRQGWSHRLMGGILLIWLLVGTLTCQKYAIINLHGQTALLYDLVLGVLGISATLTAAKDFPHKKVHNQKGQSGTLHHQAIVTQAEMIEHAFYQALNLCQAMYLHLMYRVLYQDHGQYWMIRLGLLGLVTSPWLLRRKFPIHSFSDNWNVYYLNEQTSPRLSPSLKRTEQSDLEVFLYQIKKGQYLFYKHVILHGINIYMAVIVIVESTDDSTTLSATTLPPYSYSWRIFWIILNTSYVMEFFLQSLAKRTTILRQTTMLWLQRWLMTSASISAMVVLWQSSSTPRNQTTMLLVLLLPLISLLSLILNFQHRYHDFQNTMVVAVMAMAWQKCIFFFLLRF